MATVRKKINKKGVVYRVDWYTPEGKRKRKDFDLKKDAEAWKGKIDVAKREGRYDEVFDVITQVIKLFPSSEPKPPKINFVIRWNRNY